MTIRKIALIGFGEAGSILGAGFVVAGIKVSAYDILFDSSGGVSSAILEKARALRVSAADKYSTAIAGADIVLSAVTASSSATVAMEAAKSLRAGQIFLDINSVSPGTKRSNAQTVEKSGADYVEAAVMAPLPPQQMRVPMLLGGRRAAELAETLRQLGMNATSISDRIGVASAVKMCRSVMIKGIEALAVESLLAARRFGAEEEVLASLDGTFPNMGWLEGQPDYLVSRVAEHGRRRAAEMREVAATLRDVGLEPTMALATAARQDWLVDEMVAYGIPYPRDRKFSWRALADALKE